MKKKHIIAMMTLCTMAAGCAEKAVETPEPKKEVVPAIELSNMDTTVNPADDFFRYANNNWIKNNPIPEEYSTYGAFTEIDQHNEILLQDIIKEVSQDTSATQGSVAQKIRDFYNAGMDTVAIDARGYSELQPYFDMIDGLNDKSDLAELMGKLHSDGIPHERVAGDARQVCRACDQDVPTHRHRLHRGRQESQGHPHFGDRVGQKIVEPRRDA